MAGILRNGWPVWLGIGGRNQRNTQILRKSYIEPRSGRLYPKGFIGLEANKLLSELVQDLNLEPRLPMTDKALDAAICTVSVEYVTRPAEVFKQVRRVLRPGARFVVTFSNRWFPPKVIKIWQDVHEFERVGMVLEYFLRDGGFTNLQTWSMRGLPRPVDDKYADRMAQSDPVFAVWAEKAA